MSRIWIGLCSAIGWCVSETYWCLISWHEGEKHSLLSFLRLIQDSEFIIQSFQQTPIIGKHCVSHTWTNICFQDRLWLSNQHLISRWIVYSVHLNKRSFWSTLYYRRVGCRRVRTARSVSGVLPSTWDGSGLARPCSTPRAYSTILVRVQRTRRDVLLQVSYN